MGPVRTETLGACLQDVQLEDSEEGHFLGSQSARQTRVRKPLSGVQAPGGQALSLSCCYSFL